MKLIFFSFTIGFTCSSVCRRRLRRSHSRIFVLIMPRCDRTHINIELSRSEVLSEADFMTSIYSILSFSLMHEYLSYRNFEVKQRAEIGFFKSCDIIEKNLFLLSTSCLRSLVRCATIFSSSFFSFIIFFSRNLITSHIRVISSKLQNRIKYHDI